MTDVRYDKIAEELEFRLNGMAWRPTVNQHPCVRSGYHLPKELIICDETLREGEETANVVLDMEDRIEIARKLEEVGIPEAEVGYVGAIPEHSAFSRELKRSGSKLKLVSHTRTYTKSDEWKKELDAAAEAGSDILCLLAQGSHTLAGTCPWMPLEAVPERVVEAVEYTKTLGVVPALTIVDGIRTPLQSFIDIYTAAAQAGVKRVYVMDGQGVALPDTAYFLTRMLRGIVGDDVEIALHFHDDYGMATANTISGIKAGASVVDTVVCGLGDKAGIAATEEIIMAAEVLLDIATHTKVPLLYDLVQTVCKCFDVQLAPNKSHVGENIVRHDIDAHINTILRGYWWAWEDIDPALFGRKRILQWTRGKLRTGTSGSIAAKIETMGLRPTEQEWGNVVNALRAAAQAHDIVLEKEFEAIIRANVSEKD